MNSSKGLEVIEKWVRLVRSRDEIIAHMEEVQAREELTTCGDVELDNRVACLLLNTIQYKLPNYGYRDSNSEVKMGRNVSPVLFRKVQLLPSLLFTINWADSGPRCSWPESYFVTYVPSINLRIVTASVDDDEVWGFTDLAIGFCSAIRGPEFGVKKIIQSWWRRSTHSEQEPWEAFWEAGLIDEVRAEAWRDQVFGKRRDQWGMVQAVQKNTGLTDSITFGTDSDLDSAQEYWKNVTGYTLGRSQSETAGGGVQAGTGRPSDLFRGAVDSLLAPYIVELKTEGFKFSAKSWQKFFGATDGQRQYLTDKVATNGDEFLQ